jgi:starch phosphorylase
LLIAGKAAPGYHMAKLIIRLAHAVAERCARSPAARAVIRPVFMPDFNVKHGQRVYPAADLSLLISTAGMEASGTGNMKFAMNGAVTLGTLDGANIEIREAVGAEHFFLFGLTADEAVARRAGRDVRGELARDPELAQVVEALGAGRYCPGDAGLFAPIVDSLRGHDPFMVIADFRAYVDAEARAASAFADVRGFTRVAILNCARSGPFSSDRSIREYAERIWQVAPVDVS